MRDAHFFHSMHHGYKGLDFEFFCSFIIFILNKAKLHSHSSISGAEALEAISWKFSLVQSFYNHLHFNLNRTRSFGFFFANLNFLYHRKWLGLIVWHCPTDLKQMKTIFGKPVMIVTTMMENIQSWLEFLTTQWILTSLSVMQWNRKFLQWAT